MKERLVVLEKITQRTEEENKELTSLFALISTAPIPTIRYKRESGEEEEIEGKDYIIDDVGVIDFN